MDQLEMIAFGMSSLNDGSSIIHLLPSEKIFEILDCNNNNNNNLLFSLLLNKEKDIYLIVEIAIPAGGKFRKDR